MMNNVLDYLEAAAGKHPNKKAVSYKDNYYSYSELRIQAGRIGKTLSQFGLKKQPIGVIAERGIETIAFFLGVLYSGNYYVPIDPELPAEKLRSVFDDAAFRVVLGPAAYVLSIHYDGVYISIDDVGDGECPIPHTDHDDPLYMVYTSGSTGKPKGVLKSHSAEISFIEAYCNTFDFSDSDVIGNQTPFFFDASAKDLYMMLKLGCSLEILPTSLFSLPPELIDYLNEKKVSFVSWVPTAISLVAQLNPFSMVKPSTLKKVFFVGEVMPMKHLNKWRAALPEIEYVNLYGQSEIAGICCYYKVTESFEDSAVLPMGKPLQNCTIYLMDGDHVIHEPGHVGELYIVSDALALEYFHDPEKTHSSFLRKDFGAGIERCFKTGDLAQYDEQGNLLFAARNDNQIKHMGHRIELGEIETVAGSLADVDRCCCLYDSAKKKIILFCQLSSGSLLTGPTIRSQLRQHLSSYMVPGKVIILDALPINANGKIDRQQLKNLI